MVAPNNAWDRLYRAMRQVDANNEDGAWTLAISGGGAGGTSSTDNTAFTPSATSVTPVAGYVGGRSVASGRTGVLAMNGSAVLQVDVISTSAAAGGGFATVGVFGSVSIQGTVTLAAGAAPFASVAVYGSPANPIYAVGSVNVVNAVGIFGSVSTTGTTTIVPPPNMTVWLANQNAGAGFASVAVYGSPTMPVYAVGSVNVVNNVGVFGSMSTLGTATIVPPPNFTVWLANQNAGAGFASVAVYGSPTMPVYAVGSVNVVNNVGIFGSVSMQGTVTLAAGAAPFASVAVYGSPAMPVYVVGSVNVQGSLGVGQISAPWSFVGSAGVTPLASFTVNFGSIPTVNLGLGTVNIGNAHGIFGSVSVLGSVNIGGAVGIFGSTSGVASVNLAPGGIVGIFGSVSMLGSVNVGGVAVVDTRASLTPTQWIISAPASGQFLMVGSAGANLRAYLHSFHLVADGTLSMQWQSPSGVAISGSMRLLPGAGFGMAGNFANGPVLMGSLSSAIYIMTAGTQNYGGVALGWVGP